MPNISSLSPAEARALIRSGGELAFFDLREEGPYSRSQPLFAVNLPLSRIEERIHLLAPRRDVPVLLFDGGEGLTARGHARLTALGYTDVRVVDGGLTDWRAAGGELFRDVNVPSKAFGEWVEAHAHTPSLSAEEVKALIDRGEDVVLLDSRPFHEYNVMTIPGSISCPGAELVLRARAAMPTPDSLVIVNCAGRTRSLIGAQSLINSGLFPRVAALRNGTIGWLLAGFELEYGATRRAPAAIPPETAEPARRAARAWAERCGAAFLSPEEIAVWDAEAAKHSLFKFDVRSPEEHAAHPVAGFRNAPGGQLVQATDDYVGVLGARLLLADDDGVRAAMTASWLRQLGWRHVAVAAQGFDGLPPAAVAPAAPPPPAVPGVTPQQLASWQAEGRAVVVDLARSPDFARAHIPDAWFAIRARLAEALPALPRAEKIVLTSGDGRLAAFAQPELQALTQRPVFALIGGTDAWRQAGRAVEGGLDNLAVPADDRYRRPYEGTDSPRAAMARYIDWEFGLVDQIRNDGTARFAVVPAEA